GDGRAGRGGPHRKSRHRGAATGWRGWRRARGACSPTRGTGGGSGRPPARTPVGVLAAVSRLVHDPPARPQRACLRLSPWPVAHGPPPAPCPAGPDPPRLCAAGPPAAAARYVPVPLVGPPRVRADASRDPSDRGLGPGGPAAAGGERG